MSQPASESGGSGTVILIVVVVLVMLVLVVAVCGGAVYFFAMTTQEMIVQVEAELAEQNRLAEISQRSARAFLDDLRAGRFDAAYESTTTEFQKGMKLEELKELVKKHPFLSQPQRDGRLNLFLVDSEDSHDLEATVPLVNGRTAKLTIKMRQVGDEWKVDRITVVEGPAAGPP